MSEWTCLLLSFSLTGVLVLEGQETQSGDDRAVTLNVGVSSAKPGEAVQVPLTLSGPGTVTVAKLAGEIGFPKKLLSFVAANQALSAELAEAPVGARVIEEADASGGSILEVTISGAKPIRAGILAYLEFRVSENAEKGVIPLKIESFKASSEEEKPLGTGEGRDGEIRVLGKDEQLPPASYY